MNTIWEFAGTDFGDIVDAVPATEDVLSAEDGAEGAPVRGCLWLRQSSILPIRLFAFGRRPFQQRYAVLTSSGRDGPPRLQLYLSDAMEQLSEELVLLSPLQLHCLPSEGSHSRFSLSARDAPPIELAAESEADRQRWMLLIGESVCPPSPTPCDPPSPDADGPAGGGGDAIADGAPSTSPTTIRAHVWPDAECLDGSSPKLCSPSLFSCSSASSLQGRVQLARSRVADNYSMGKILAQGDDYMVVEGLHLATQRSHALKLLSKQSPRFRRETGRRSLGPRVCCRLLAHCIEEVYEGPNHVAMVMHWGTHELDSQHDLSVAVLEALRLLRELLPSSTLPQEGLKLSAQDVQKLMARLFAIDSHLQANLFI